MDTAAMREYGSKPRSLGKSDLTSVGRDSVAAAGAAVVGYWLGQLMPDMPEEIKAATWVLLFAGIKAGWKLLADTRHFKPSPP